MSTDMEIIPEKVDGITVQLNRAVEPLTEAEKYLVAILLDASGIDLAEFAINDTTNKETGCYRAYPHQWAWFRDESPMSIAACSRSVGKCLDGDTMITLGDGSQRRIAELVGENPEIMAWDPATGLTKPAATERIYFSGVKPVKTLTTRLGREVTATGDHRVLTSEGWKILGEIRPGDRVASPRTVRVAGNGTVAEHEIRFLALAICDAKLTQPTVNYTKGDPELVDDFCDSAERFGNIQTRRTWHGSKNSWDVLPTRICQKGRVANPVLECVKRHGLYGKRSPEKHIPDGVFTLGLPDLALFLGRLLSGDGCVERGAFTYSSASRRMVEQVRHLLLRFGVISTMRHRKTSAVKGGPTFDSWELRVPPTAMNRLWTAVGPHLIGEKSARAEAAAARKVRRSPLDSVTAGDIIWDEVQSISDAGTAKTYDITMAGEPNFLANDIVVHNSESIMLEVLAFPFSYPKQEAVLGTPEGAQADNLTQRIEETIGACRLFKEMLKDGQNRGITHKPFNITWANGARFFARVPQRSGLGFKGIHPIKMFVDEAQDVTTAALEETPEVVRFEVPGAQWKLYGVSKGIRGDFFEKATRPDSDFKVHHYTAMHRPGWNDEERSRKVKLYGGETASAYLRNVLGLPGDEENNIFLLPNYMKCVDTQEGSSYNVNEYFFEWITADEVRSRGGGRDVALSADDQAEIIFNMLQFPAIHKEKYSVFWAGMDFGLVNDPSELIVVAEYEPDTEERNAQKKLKMAVPRKGTSRFKVLTRIKIQAIPAPLQAELIMHVINHYRPRAFAMDGGGNGLPAFQILQQLAGASRLIEFEDVDEDGVPVRTSAKQALTVIKNYKFGAKLLAEIDENLAADLGNDAPLKDLLKHAGIYWEVADRATELLRGWVDTERMLFPYDTEIIQDMNAQTFKLKKAKVDAFGRSKRSFSKGEFHILDAMRFWALACGQQSIEEMIARGDAEPDRKPVVPLFGFGGGL